MKKHLLGLILAVLFIADFLYVKSGLSLAAVAILPTDSDEEKTVKRLLNESEKSTLTESEKKAKDIIDAEIKAAYEKMEGESKKSIDALEVKFTSLEEELKDSKTEAMRLKIESESKNMSFADGLAKAFEDADNIKMLQEFKESKIKNFAIEVKAPGDMSLANIAGLSSANVQMLPGILPIPSRKMHIRQLLSVGQMSTSSIHYLQEINDQGAITTWTDNSGNKPQVDMNLREQSADSEFIAGFLRITRKMLDDIPAMRSFLQARLLELYLNAEDQQLLNGNGTSPQIDGLITNAQAYSGTRTIPVEKIIDACAQVEGNDFQATGILLSPKQYYAILMTKGNTLEYSLPGGSAVNIVNGQIYICGIPVYKSTALFTQLPAQDTFLVGDFVMGAQMFIRENPIVRFFEEDADNVTKNKFTVRVEGRITLAIYYPNAFVTGSLNPTPS